MKKILSVLLSVAMLLTLLPLGVAADHNTLTIPEANEIGLAQGRNSYTSDKYYVTGAVAAINNFIYGNMYIVDENDNLLYIYGTYNEDGTVRFDGMENQPEVGDTVTVYGVIGTYNGNEAQMKNGWITDIVKGEGMEDTDPPADSELTIPEVIDLALSKLHNVFTTNKYYVTGVITEIYNDIYGNMYLTDADGNVLTLYGTYNEDGSSRFDVMDNQPVVGDTITVYGIIGQYNGTPQMKNGWIQEIVTDNEPSVPDVPVVPDAPTTLGEILDAAFALQPGESLPYEVSLTGIVISINEPYNTTYGNITVGIRVENRYVVCYRLKGNELDEIKTGDTITVRGTLCNYNGTVEFNYPTLTNWFDSDYESIPMKMVTNPQVGVAYKLGIVEEHLSTSDVYYLIGEKNAHYLMTGNSTYAAMDVYLEETVGGYYLYLDYFGTKKYINMVEDPTNGYINATYESVPATVYTYNTERNTMTAIAPNGVLHALGSHSYDDYTTIGSIQMGAHYYAHFYQPDSDAPDYLIYEIADSEVSIIGYTKDIPADLVIPDTIAGYPVTRIAYNAFYGCTTLQTVSIPEGITLIGVEAFYGCTALQSVSIPKSVTNIHGGVFWECSSLTDIYYAGSYADRVEMDITHGYNGNLRNATWHYAEDREPDAASYLRYEIADGQVTIVGVSFDIPDDVIIPETIESFPVTTIRRGAFEEAYTLKTVSIPASITVIEDYAFIYCDELTDVFYGGTEKDRSSITMTNDRDSNPWLLDATWHYTYSLIAGDVNGDGAVSLVDIALLQRYLNGWDVTINLDACDVNADEEINIRDFGLLQQYLNGWDVVLGQPQ